jgi:aryl-alcohol dehydrogenase-like predicted oxidoreductase
MVRARGIAVTVYEPLAGGILSGTPFAQVRERWIGSAWEDLSVYPELMCLENAETVSRIVDRLRGVAEGLDATVAQVALAWVLRQRGVWSAIPGCSSPGRARANAVAGDLVLPDDVLQTIEDELIPLTSQLAGRG